MSNKVQLNSDGEVITITTPPDENEPSADTAKGKFTRMEFNTPPWVLWARPFPDRAGYDTAELYIDPEAGKQWGYTLLLKWHIGDGTSRIDKSRRIYGHGYADKDSAQNAGAAAYEERLNYVSEKSAEPTRFKWSDFFVVSIALFLAVSAIACIIGYFVLSTFHQDPPNSSTIVGIAVLIAFFSIAFSFFTAASKEDFR